MIWLSAAGIADIARMARGAEASAAKEPLYMMLRKFTR